MPVQADRSLWVVPLACSCAINGSMLSSSTGLLEESMLRDQSLKKRNDKMLKYLQMKTSLALAVSCLTFAPVVASAMPITKTVNVSVYQLCNSLNECASTGPAGDVYYAAATNKIWEQAGISVTFSFVSKIVSDAFYDITTRLATPLTTSTTPSFRAWPVSTIQLLICSWSTATTVHMVPAMTALAA